MLENSTGNLRHETVVLCLLSKEFIHVRVHASFIMDGLDKELGTREGPREEFWSR
jgi:hypothetical protein